MVREASYQDAIEGRVSPEEYIRQQMEKGIPEPNPDLLSVRLSAQVHEAKALLRTAAGTGAYWVCSHCGTQMPSPRPNAWLDPAELRRQAARGSDLGAPIFNIALLRMLKEGEFEANNRLEVRRTERP